MITDEPTDTLDLPEHCDHDHVVIYPNNAPKDPPFYAVPFDYVGDDDLGNGYYQEPEEFEVTDKYREAVAERSDVDISDVKLERDDLPTDDIDPI